MDSCDNKEDSITRQQTHNKQAEQTIVTLKFWY